MELTQKDRELIEKAAEVISKNYDPWRERHIVGAALRCKNGKIYVGINVNAIHGSCAEVVALGAALAAGEREFETIVAVRGKHGEQVVPPCGNCRQILSEYCPDCSVIISGSKKLSVWDLLPEAYRELPNKEGTETDVH